MNKSELISAMAAESQMSKADAKKALDAFITSVTNAMKAGDKVSLVGFGTFSVSERAERTGINPSRRFLLNIDEMQSLLFLFRYTVRHSFPKTLFSAIAPFTSSMRTAILPAFMI